MTRNNKLLVVVLGFNGLTAVVGSIGLLFGFMSPPVSWLEHTIFHSYVIPGLVLLFVVGGSASYGVYTLIAHKGQQIVAEASGLIMLLWITAELLLLRRFSWLQILYYFTGLSVVLLASPAYPPSRLTQRLHM